MFELLQEQIRAGVLPVHPDGNSFYDYICDTLRANNDAQYGIISARNQQGDWVRDATLAKPVDACISPDAPIFEVNNLLLRCLSRLRPIDYAIAQKHHNNTFAVRLRLELKNKLADLLSHLQSISWSPRALKEAEEAFNTMLVSVLHEAGLAQGCADSAAAQKLLFHYRNLSSLMVPACRMITLNYDAVNRVCYRETNYPVTVKTQYQHQTLAAKRHHATEQYAIQEADSIFASLLADDTRMLAAQARKTHLVGVKNAFIVKNEVFFDRKRDIAEDELASEENTLWLARTGSPAYIGSGETAEEVLRHTAENLEQIRSTASNLMGARQRLHVTCLNTDTRLQHQNIIVDNIRKAVEDAGDGMSYLPSNALGLLHKAQVSHDILLTDLEVKLRGRAPFVKAKRIEDAANTLLLAAANPHTLSVVNCASGQDRTGTAVEDAVVIWYKRRYKAHNLRSDIVTVVRALGASAAEITAHLVHGSPGMKKESKANNMVGSGKTFPDGVSRRYYLKVAGTNKKNPVGDVSFLLLPVEDEVQTYRRNLSHFIKTVKRLPKNRVSPEFIDSARALVNAVKDIAEPYPERLDAQKMYQLNRVLSSATLAIKSPRDSKAIADLQLLSKTVSGKASPKWKALGVALMVFAGLAFIAAIPLAVSGIGSVAAVAAVFGGVALTCTGLGLFTFKSKSGLAKSACDFRAAVLGMPPEQEDTDEHQDVIP